MGRELVVPIIGLMHWGDRHLAGPAGPPRLTRHRDRGGTLSATLTCDACGQSIPPAGIELVRGPALRRQARGSPVDPA